MVCACTEVLVLLPMLGLNQHSTVQEGQSSLSVTLLDAKICRSLLSGIQVRALSKKEGTREFLPCRNVGSILAFDAELCAMEQVRSTNHNDPFWQESKQHLWGIVLA